MAKNSSKEKAEAKRVEFENQTEFLAIVQNHTTLVLFSSRELRAALAFWKQNYPKWNITRAFGRRGTVVKKNTKSKCFCTRISNL